MKSLQVTQASYIPASDKDNYSDLHVMKSNAGWYIGTTYTDPETKEQEPGSRDSDYFLSKKEAEAYLKLIETGKALLRIHP